MTTVKKFKDLDVPFVFGDMCRDAFTSEIYGNLKDDCGWVYRVIHGSSSFDGDEIISFAWRPINTLPSNPKFKFEKSRNGGLWRPLLDQPKKSVYDVDAHVSGEKIKPRTDLSDDHMEKLIAMVRNQWSQFQGKGCKPVSGKLPAFSNFVRVCEPIHEIKPSFTQEMVEFKAGDFVSVLPPKGVGQSEAKFLLIGFDLMGDAIIQHCCSKHISDTRKSRLIAPIDNRTPLEIEIESLMVEWGHDKSEIHKNNVVYSVVEQMINTGYHR